MLLSLGVWDLASIEDLLLVLEKSGDGLLILAILFVVAPLVEDKGRLVGIDAKFG
jgi:hypothetical protein